MKFKKLKKNILLLLFLSLGLTACNTSEKKIDKLEIAKQYYQALDTSDGAVMQMLINDSLITKETDYHYKQTYSKKKYIEEWLKWDSVFNPTYKILEIHQENDIVKAKISKVDKRIYLLHEEPTVWRSVIRFEADKISLIEKKNVIFNEKTWDRNKTALLSWINENHPELNGFIYEQTKTGALKYLKAMTLYNTKK